MSKNADINRIGGGVAVLFSLAFASCIASADTYYWRGSNTSWSDWTNISDGGWSLARESHVAPSHVPGTDPTDVLWPFGITHTGANDYDWRIGFFNLGGGTYTLASYSVGSGAVRTWKNWQIHLTNGTLSVSNTQKITGSTPLSYYLYKDTTLNYYSPGYVADASAIGASGLFEQWYPKAGSVMNVYNKLTISTLRSSVESGATLNLATGTFFLTSVAHENYKNTISSAGTLLLPNGIEWTADYTGIGRTKDYSKSFIVTQTAGETRMGGDFKKSATENHSYKVQMKYVLQGGTLTAEENKSVSFVGRTGKAGEEVFAEMPASSSATVQTLAGSTLDMSLFTYGSGAALTKTGPGTLILKNRPATVDVTAGTLRFAEAVSGLSGVTVRNGGAIQWPEAGSDATGLVLAEGAAVVFAKTCASATGASIPADYAKAVFALDNSDGAFATGSTVVTSDDAGFLAHVVATLNAGATLPEGLAAAVSGDAVRLVPALSHTFTSDGELNLSESSGWNKADFAGKDVLVSGAATVAVISPSSPAFSSITLTAGATLKVSGEDVELPPVTLLTPSTLLVPGGSSAVMTNGFSATGDVSGLPVVKVETNGVLTVARGTKFKNCAVKLYGEIGVPPVYGDVKLANDQGIQFGCAAAGETTYFAMESIGGNINISGNTTVDNQKELTFAWADSGGRVCTIGDILLKDTTFNTPSGAWHYIGKMIGGYNPDDSGVRVVLDNTVMPLRRFNWFLSGTVVCRNGGRLERSDYHAGTDCRLTIDRYARVVFEGPGTGLFMPYANVWRPFYYDIWLDGGVDQFTFRDGATMAAHSYWGGNHSVLVFSNGVYQVGTLPYVSSDKYPNPPNGDPRNWTTNAFTGCKWVRIEKGGKLFFQSAKTLGGTEWDRYMTLADKPIKGEGDFVMTNGVPGRGFAATVVSAANTATGSISVAPSADPTTLYFNNGANWAGTVVAGNIALTNLAAAASPATVTFATLNLAGRFPIRIWKNGEGSFSSDKVNLTAALTGSGIIEPVLMDGLRLAGGESFTLGTCPASGVDVSDATAHVKRGWSLLSEPADGGKVTLVLKYTPTGLIVNIR